MSAPRQIIVAVYPGVELLDVTGPAEVFTAASRLIGATGGGYDVRLASRDLGEVQTAGGVRLVADTAWAEVRPGVDTLVVPGAVRFGAQGAEPVVDTELVSWVRTMAPRARRIAAVCAGAHVLAAAGLLDGQTATTHWCTAPALAKDHPAVTVDPDPIFVQAGRVWTCAGGSSAMDLALALVAKDHGHAVALRIARWLVMYLKRPGGQSQFSATLAAQEPSRDDLGELLAWIADHPQGDLSVPVLADRMRMSVRHFSRVFRTETGLTPAAYVEAARVEFARRLLEDTDRTLDDVAAACGLGSVETLHRSFRRRLSTTPAEYRRRFHPQYELIPTATASRR